MEIVRDNVLTDDGEKMKLNEMDPEKMLKSKEDLDVLRNLEDNQLSEMVEFSDGSKGKLLRNGNNVSVYKAKDVLEIPNELFGEKLTDSKRQSLMNGNTILINKDGNNLYVTVDAETNSVIVRGDHEIGLSNPHTIGDSKEFGYKGYTLNERDRVLMANGLATEQKLFCGDQGFFLAELQLTSDKRGFIFSNVVSLSPEEAKAFQKEMERAEAVKVIKNEEKAPCVEEAFQKSQEENKEIMATAKKIREESAERKVVDERVVEQPVMGENTVKKETFKEEFKETPKQEQGVNMGGAAAAMAGAAVVGATAEKIVNNKELDGKFITALEGKDWKLLNSLKQEGYVPGDDALERMSQLKKEGKISENDVTAVNTLYNLNKKEKNNGKAAFAGKDKEDKGMKYTGSPKQAINSLFQNM